jgi:hypothetical protein
MGRQISRKQQMIADAAVEMVVRRFTSATRILDCDT